MTMEQVLDLLPTGVIVLNAAGQIAHCNPAAESILSMSVAGRSWCGIINEAFSPRYDDGYEISLKNGRRVSLAIRSLHPEPGQLILINDLTETRELQERLNRQHRLAEIGQLAAELAHQIRTPLATALLYASHLKKPELAQNKKQKFIENVHESLHHIENQVRDMLFFARGGGKIAEEITTTEVIKSVETTISSVLTNYEAELITEDVTKSAKFKGNLAAIVGALQNLINNALEASGKKSKIRLTIKKNSENVLEFEVKDQGPGMTAEVKEKICQAFFTTRANGTGLGLAVVQSVAEAHQGTLEIDSIPDVGTTVHFRVTC